MRYPGRKVCASLGLSGSVIFFSCWVVAVAFDGEWAFGLNTLSDLGISDSKVSAILFNWFGCFLCSVMWLLEAISITRTETGFGRLYGIVSIPSMLLLACIGIFNKGFGSVHIGIAFTYLAFTVVSMVLTCLSDFYRGRRIYVAVTLTFPVISIVSLIVLPFAGFEAIGIGLTVLWSAMVAESYGKYGGAAEKTDNAGRQV